MQGNVCEWKWWSIHLTLHAHALALVLREPRLHIHHSEGHVCVCVCHFVIQHDNTDLHYTCVSVIRITCIKTRELWYISTNCTLEMCAKVKD